MEKYCYPAQERATLEALRQPFAVYQFLDNRVVTLVLSDGFCSLFGYTDRAVAYYDMDQDMYRDTHPDDAARIADAAYRFATEGGKYEVIYRSKVPGGSEYRMIHAYGEHVFTDTGVRLAQVWYSDEGLYRETGSPQGLELTGALSDALRENSQVKASRYDYLTGLPSMTYFFELSEAGKARIRATGGSPVLMYLNFLGMKFYNARHGFAEGDRLLRAFGHLLAETFGNESCCRIDADHFVAFSEEAGLEEKLRRLFRDFRNSSGASALPVHVGVYAAEEESVHTSVACDRARLACRTLEGRYESAVARYSKELGVDAVRRQYFVENLDRALAEGWSTRSGAS